MNINLDDIIPNRFQPREVFDEKELNILADSIRQHGVLEPILVRPVSNKFEIIAGERRYKASALAGLTKIPALVRQMDDKQSSIAAYIENFHRSNTSAIEDAKTIDRLLKNNNMSQEELAKSLGLSQPSLANKLRLLTLPIEIQDAVMKKEISERHARCLLTVKERDKQIELLNKIKEKRMSVRELESEIKNMNGNMFIPNDVSSTQVNNPDGNLFMHNQELNTNNSFIPNFNNNVEMNGNMGSNIQQNQTNTNSDGFMNFLNNYDNNHAVLETQTVGNDNLQVNNSYANNDGFMNFLNDYDNNNPIPASGVATPESYQAPTPSNPVEMPGQSVQNNYDNTNNMNSQNNDGFMNFLNNYDNNNPIPASGVATPESYQAPTPSNPVEPNGQSVQNNYDNTNNMNSQNNDGFMNFLNNYENNSTSTDIETINDSQFTTDSFMNNYTKETVPNNNVMINNVNPPITTNFNANSYVEDNPNFSDVSVKPIMGSVNEIINELKVTVDKIKAESKFKIDTDEIDFDDVYQITIKIDKRDF